MQTNPACVMELSVLQNMETACRLERAQSAAWTHLARERGSLQIIKDELVKINRDRLHQVANDQISEFADRQKRREGGNPGSSNRPRARNNKRSRSPRKSPRRDKVPRRRRDYRGRSPRDNKGAASSKYNYSADKKQDEKKSDPPGGKNASSGFA